MARKRIQGITIEIGGDTTKLQSALKGVENRLKDTQNALKDVDRLLKLDPGNTELLTQKQRLLTDSIEATGDKLKTLRDAAEQANQQLAEGKMSQAEFDALQREIIDTENSLKSLTREMQDFGSVSAQKLAAAGGKLKEAGDNISAVGSALTRRVTAPIVAVGAASVAAFRDVDDGLDTIVTKTGATGKTLEDMEERAKRLATTIPTDFATAGAAVGEVNTRFGLTGDALEALSGKFIRFAALNKTDVTTSVDSVQSALAAFNLDASRAGDMLDILNAAGQETGVSVDRLAADMAANGTQLRELGLNAVGAARFLSRLEKNGVDSSTALAGLKTALKASVKDGRSMSQAVSELQGRLSGAASATQAMAMASELFGAKAGPALGAAIYEGRLSLEGLNGAMRTFAGNVDDTFAATQDPIDEFAMAMNDLKLAGMDLVSAAAPMIKSVAGMVRTAVSDIRGWWESLPPEAQETIVQLAAIAAAVGPVLVVVGKVTGAVGGLLTYAPKVIGAIKTTQSVLAGLWAVFAANPVYAVALALTGLVVGITALWHKSEAFRNFWIGLWEGIKNTVGNAFDAIRRFFSFKWELPKIPLPHFTITGRFSLAPPQIPHIDVEWYRKAMEDGMILNSPTIFGMMNGRLQGGGDAGPEAVVGVDSLRKMVAGAVASALPGSQPRQMTVVLQLNEAELGRVTLPIIEAEEQRVGVRLARG